MRHPKIQGGPTKREKGVADAHFI